MRGIAQRVIDPDPSESANRREALGLELGLAASRARYRLARTIMRAGLRVAPRHTDAESLIR